MGLRARPDIPRPTAIARIAGLEFTITDLAYRDANRLLLAFPPPIAPLGSNPTKGTLSEPIPRTDDPKYQAAMLQRRVNIRSAEIAAALGWEDANGQTLGQVADGDVARWAKDAREWLETEWTDAEVAVFSRTLDGLAAGVGGSAEEPGKG